MRIKTLLLLGLIMGNISAVWAQDISGINKKNLVKVSGGLGWGMNMNSVVGREASQNPFTYNFNANINVSIINTFSLPFTFAYSSNKVATTQPTFNITSFTPSYKWLKLYLGSTSMSFSQYTMAGAPFLGGGFELTPKGWKIAGFYGRLAVAQEPNVSGNIPTVSYDRKGYGMALSHNSKNLGNFEFSFLRASDDRYSVSFIPENVQTLPASNLAISLGYNHLLFKKINFNLKYASSAYTSDIRSSGQTTRSHFLKYVFDAKSSTTFYDAVDVSMGYKAKSWGVQMAYNRVDPGFKSLGAYNVVNNLEAYTFNFNTTLLKGKCNINTRTGLQRDNLDQSNIRTSYKWANSFNASMNLIPKSSINVGYNNFTSFTNLLNSFNPISIQQDTLSIKTISETYNTSISYQLGKKDNPQTLSLSMNRMNSNVEKGNPERTNQNTNATSNAINLSHSTQLKSLEVTMSNSFNYNIAESGTTTSINYGVSNSLSKPLFKKKLNASLSNTYNQVNAQTSSSVIASNLSMSMALKPKDEKNKNKLLKNHNFAFSFRFTKQMTSAPGPSVSEMMSSLSYNWSF